MDFIHFFSPYKSVWIKTYMKLYNCNNIMRRVLTINQKKVTTIISSLRDENTLFNCTNTFVFFVSCFLSSIVDGKMKKEKLMELFLPNLSFRPPISIIFLSSAAIRYNSSKSYASPSSFVMRRCHLN